MMISVSRDRKSIMLCEGAQGQPGVWLWIGVDDADEFFAEFLAKGAHDPDAGQVRRDLGLFSLFGEFSSHARLFGGFGLLGCLSLFGGLGAFHGKTRLLFLRGLGLAR